MFDPIVDILVKGFEYLHKLVYFLTPNLNISYGLTIILSILIIKFITLPLHIKQIKTSKITQKIQPEMKKLQEKYKSDPKKLQEEMMNLYKEYKINPFSGCLPTLIQLPILLLFFQLFYKLPGLQENAISFLWLPNLAEKDPYLILPILAVLTGYYQGKMTMPLNSGEEGRSSGQNNTMNIVLSIMLGVFTLSVSSAVGIYYVFSNIVSIIINYFIYKSIK